MALRDSIAQRDFAGFYAELGLSADCDLERFKRECRRVIADLHPDRPGNATTPQESGERLRKTIDLYTEAMRFHRRHGRLPGGSVAHGRISGVRPVVHLAAARISHAPAADDPRLRTRLLVALGLLAMTVGAVILFGDDGATADSGGEALPVAAVAPAQDVDVRRADQLRIGMRMAQVIAIQGEPLRRGDALWEYGPSWIRFERGRLIDLHSSPFHPLKASSPLAVDQPDAPLPEIGGTDGRDGHR